MSLWSKCFVPFDFSKLRGNHPGEPMPTTFDNSVAIEDGSEVSTTPLANFTAGVLLTLVVLLFATVIGDLRSDRAVFNQASPGPQAQLPR